MKIAFKLGLKALELDGLAAPCLLAVCATQRKGWSVDAGLWGGRYHSVPYRVCHHSRESEAVICRCVGTSHAVSTITFFALCTVSNCPYGYLSL